MPSLLAAAPNSAAGPRNAVAGVPDPRSLMDLLFPGFNMVLLLRDGQFPVNEQTFRERLLQLLAQLERGAKKLDVSADDIHQAKFAFCALIDELVLGSKFQFRSEWERKPLQLELFGEHLAGDRFFDHLETLRAEGAARIQVLQVFHMCLLLGFQGRYAFEGSEKLGYLTARLGDEIAHFQGKRAAFSPHWAPPDQVANKLRNEVPLWVMASVFAVLGLLAFLGLRTHLSHTTQATLDAYNQVIQLAPQAAWVNISLP